ncbi:glycosyltransferase [Tropicimonas sp. TH_r6]|uniref:glycosyltransferase n=1 Tax=Tropicimonas sp. TH_r6 TaxID=3082085 RepID=UPI002953B459|nr:glycosyltransferase [Tropicimonas sp. TH_r6]MDV7144302.1 glycosyltransferase [Tropicimonas sp. TH_r6]
MARISIIGGDGRRSGIPRLIQLLCTIFSGPHELRVISDVDRGGYEFLAEMGISHVEIPGLASGLNPLRVFSAFRRLRRELIDEEPDVIWVQSTVSVMLARIVLVELRWFRRRPVALVVSYNGVPFGPGRAPGIALAMRIQEYLFLATVPRHLLIFISKMDLDLIPRMLKARHVIAMAINCSNLGISQATAKQTAPAPGAPRRIVMTTRHSYQKNLEAAAEVFARLPDGYALCLLGPDTESEQIKAAFRTRMTPAKFEAVEFRGPQSDVVPFLLDADHYLMTSRYEGMPFGAIEAFECGLPIALTDVGGTFEIAGVHPLFAEISVIDEDAIAHAASAIHAQVDRYRERPADWRRKIQTAWATRFSLPVWTESVEACLDSALEDLRG